MSHLGRSYSSDRYSVCGKRSLTIAVMNVELPPFKNGEHNSGSMSTIDRVITPLNSASAQIQTVTIAEADDRTFVPKDKKVDDQLLCVNQGNTVCSQRGIEYPISV